MGAVKCLEGCSGLLFHWFIVHVFPLVFKGYYKNYFLLCKLHSRTYIVTLCFVTPADLWHSIVQLFTSYLAVFGVVMLGKSSSIDAVPSQFVKIKLYSFLHSFTSLGYPTNNVSNSNSSSYP